MDMSHHQVLKFNDVAFPLEHHVSTESNTAVQVFKVVTNSEYAGKKLTDENQM